MYSSDTEANEKAASKTALVYLLVSLFCCLFGAVYESYSHGVYSGYMIYAFVFPLAGGALPFCVLSLTGTKKYPCRRSRNLYHSGIAALTVGSIVRGILDIYGTTNFLASFYWPAGILLAAAGVIFYLAQILAAGNHA